MRGDRVLVIDDDPQFAEVLAAALLCGGAEPTIAGDLATARNLLTGGAFELVLLDLTLPDSTPEGSMRAIPEILAAGVRVVVITGSPVTEGLDALCRKWGASEVLGKDVGFLGRVMACVGGELRLR